MSLGRLFLLVLTLSLNAAVVIALARGQLRRFWLIFAYCLLQILATFADDLTFFIFKNASLYYDVYWIVDFTSHACVTAIVILLIRETIREKRVRDLVAYALVLFMLIVTVASGLALYNHRLNSWLLGISRNLSFGEEVLNFVLWGMVLQNGEFDLQLLLASAGIGIQVTGEVVGLTLRFYTPEKSLWIPESLIVGCEYLCLIFWIWAFSIKPRTIHVDPPELPHQVGLLP